MTKFAKFFNGKESKTITEAKRKKRFSKIGILVCVAVIIALLVVVALISPTTEFDVYPIVMPFASIAVLLIIFFWLKLNCARKEIFILQNQYCSVCGERYEVGNASYAVQRDNVLTTKHDNYIQADTYTYVMIKCKCAYCNNEHTYEYDFLTKRTKTNFYGATLSEENYSLIDRLIEHFDW